MAPPFNPNAASDMTEILDPSKTGLARAAEILSQGGLVGFPTETVYGLGGDARNGASVAGIYAAKGRPAFNPLIVHLADLDAVRRYAHLDEMALTLAQAFWPGPLTLVLPLRSDSGLSSLVTAGLDSVAIRVPAHPLAQALLRAFGGPLAAPSANPSGRISPTTADHVRRGLEGRIAAILDGGPCSVGVESTILSLDGQARLLRAGGLPLEAIEALIGPVSTTGDDATKPTAPGQLASHYAPKARLRLNAVDAPGEVLIGFGPVKAALTLSDKGDLTEAAANLFAILHQADDLAGPGGLIAVAPIPDEGLGRAINDRLARAAAPRP